MISIVTPAFNEADNLPSLYERLAGAMAVIGEPWEWVIVDDHSRDATFEAVRALHARDPRVSGLRLARNSGSHVAITCGLHHTAGDAAIMLAADLQDPPETMRAMLEAWRSGAQVVWAVRRERPGDRAHARFAALYYWIMRHVVGMKQMPARGADFFLIDRAVVDAFRTFPERNVSVLALITWLGFEQTSIEYDKQPRASGRSGWTLAKKIKLVVDSVVSFSDAPIRLCWYLAATLAAVALLAGVSGLLLLPTMRSALLLIVALVSAIGAVQMLAMGILGEYLSRALDEARRRPPYVIEATAGARRLHAVSTS